MIATDIRVSLHYTDEEIIRRVCEWLPVLPSEIRAFRLLKKRLRCDARPDFSYDLTVALALNSEREAGLLKMKKKVRPVCLDVLHFEPIAPPPVRPIVVGCGPAGLFCALLLAEAGARPILLERGVDVDERRRAIERFHKTGIPDAESNVQFGEGGAGAFSDGKLKAGRDDPYKLRVLHELVDAGASEEILYVDAPHLGTDKLPDIVKRLRARLIELGADVLFSARLTDIGVKDGTLRTVTYQKDGREVTQDARAVFLATGHSAHDVFRMLRSHGVQMMPRPFGIGVRIEHPRETVNRWKYGEHHPTELPTADYHLVTHLPSGRNVYSFCMCPGGTVVAATSDRGRVVTNGMSEYDRMGENSNSALLVTVTPSDFPDETPLGGLALQERLERAAYRVGGEDHRAPAQRLEDFMADRASLRIGEVVPTYPLGVTLCRTDDYLPSALCAALREAVGAFDAWLPGFYHPDAVLTGVETRSTSPVRVLRDAATYETPTVRGLYPIGEGAGYAGGIVTSAIDGLRAAEAYLIAQRKQG